MAGAAERLVVYPAPVVPGCCAAGLVAVPAAVLLVTMLLIRTAGPAAAGGAAAANTDSSSRMATEAVLLPNAGGKPLRQLRNPLPGR